MMLYYCMCGYKFWGKKFGDRAIVFLKHLLFLTFKSLHFKVSKAVTGYVSILKSSVFSY